MQNTSKYDPSRATVGSIYRDAQLSHDGSPIIVGDMAHEMKKSLVDDLNETIESNPYQDRPFYITLHEKKDLQMPNCIIRRRITTLYRPYPEDDTVVFWVDPKSSDVRFCWCLPHWTEMGNILNTMGLYENEYIQDIRAWKAMDLHHFGFTKDQMGNWIPNLSWKDKKLVDHSAK